MLSTNLRLAGAGCIVEKLCVLPCIQLRGIERADLQVNRAQGDELVLALDHAVVAGLRIAFAQFAHGLRHLTE